MIKANVGIYKKLVLYYESLSYILEGKKNFCISFNILNIKGG